MCIGRDVTSIVAALYPVDIPYVFYEHLDLVSWSDDRAVNYTAQNDYYWQYINFYSLCWSTWNSPPLLPLTAGPGILRSSN